MKTIDKILENSRSLLSKLAKTNCEIPLRTKDCKLIDNKFILQANVLIHTVGADNTLFIIKTGHSIPIGANLYNKYGMPISWNQGDVSKFDPTNLGRILSQIKTFPFADPNKPVTPINSKALLIDCHEPIDFDHFPNIDTLEKDTITKIVIMEEARIGLMKIQGCLLEDKLNDYSKHGLKDIKRYGIDPRFTEKTNRAGIHGLFKSRTIQINQPRYKEPSIEKKMWPPTVPLASSHNQFEHTDFLRKYTK